MIYPCLKLNAILDINILEFKILHSKYTNSAPNSPNASGKNHVNTYFDTKIFN